MGSEPLVRKEAYQYTLETKGLLIDEEEFGNIIVKALPDGKYLRIRDLATIELGRESYSSTATLKAEPSQLSPSISFREPTPWTWHNG